MPLYPDDWNLSYVRDAYGPIYGAQSVQIAIRNTLKLWLPSYIYEFNRQAGTDVLTPPIEYERLPDDRTAPRNVTAAVVTTVAGTAGDPEREGDGTYDVWWKADILAWVYGTKDFWETQAITHAYATAVRAVLLQHRSLGDFAADLRWNGESFRYGEFTSARYVGEATVAVDVFTRQTINDLLGPPLAAFAPDPADALPSLHSTAAPPDITQVDVTVTNAEQDTP